MKKSSKILIAFFVIILLGLLTWGFFLARDRYSSTKYQDTSEEKITNDNPPSQTETTTGDSENLLSEETSEDSEESETLTEDDTFLDVSSSDCNNGCKNFEDPEDLTYCKQTCGLTTPKKELTGCDAVADLEKDYCLKDQAISKTDSKICDQIEDGNIKKTCQNRIIEDIVDKQMEQQ